ncbi:MAG: type I DNA topoisomerase [Candidatus Fervidibacter sp.]|uniref:type I DNA topoisomerase n=1 Tax=Candidatus Fervidibacter sp. TaxID=3100871 RepID=UPI004049E0EC
MAQKRRRKQELKSGQKQEKLESAEKKSPPEGKKLIIVESPAKARTVQQIVGDEFKIESTMGHIMDLPERKFGVDLENGFKPEYVVRPKRKDIIKRLREMAKEASEVYLASDPDREGEAIAWHVAQVIKRPDAKRIEFHEITKPAVLKALQNPRDIDTNLVNAQQARRVLDRIFGYTLSPLLWQKIKRNLSAGRVQSVALRLVVEREREIKNFVPQEYWSITATLTPEDKEAPFDARLVQVGERKVTTPERDAGKTSDEATSKSDESINDEDKKDGAIVISNEVEARVLVSVLEKARYSVLKVERGERKRTPLPPFITSTLQQVASRQLGFNPTRTMRIAQQLYEGIDLGDEGRVGLITYMRTDSPRVSEVAQAQAADFIRQTFGNEFLPNKPRQFKARKSAQEAHEAIRPTSVFRTPEKVKPYLTEEQFALYSLIWKRFVASQMADAVYDTLTVDILAKSDGKDAIENGSPEWMKGVSEFLFRASGRTLKFAGWLAVYDVDADEKEKGEGHEGDEVEGLDIPDLTEGEDLQLLELKPEQHFTKPPARYTQATLVKALEELGIGRPSTYAPTVDTIVKRGYVELKGKQLVPTPLGTLVCDKLVQFFPDLLSVDFTARMEDSLDEVEDGKRNWQEVVRYFYEPFKDAFKRAERWMSKEGGLTTDQKCPLCGASMVLKFSAYGPFLSCERYPGCRALIPFEEGATKQCTHCGNVMVRRGNDNTRYFLCLQCGSVEAVDGQEMVKCPECGEGVLVPRTVRKGKMKGRIFFSCSRYPNCKFATWDKPLPTPCPKCGGLLVERRPKNGNPIAVCLNENCGYIQELVAQDEEE